jgi:Cu/Ag efflux pump CusA
MGEELRKSFSYTEWEVWPQERDPLEEVFNGRPGEYLLKLFGPDLNELDRLDLQVRNALSRVAGVVAQPADVLKGAPELAVRADSAKCTRRGVPVAAVERVLALAREGQAVALVREGEGRSPLVLCWSPRWREDVDAPLNLPVEGAGRDNWHPLRDLVTSTEKISPGDPEGGYLIGPRTVAIYHEQGRRMVAMNIKVPAGNSAALIEVGAKIRSLVQEPFQAEWVRR